MTRRRSTMPAWLRLVAVLVILWGAAGVYAWLQQVRLGADAMGPPTAYDRALYASLPIWYNALYAVATWCGLAGGVALLAGSRFATALFAASLAAVVIQFGWLFAATDIIAEKGAGNVVPFPMAIVAIAAVQLWLSLHARRRGWLR